ncbi:MAG: PASTA domain-containing protein, partial [Sharpea porci]
NLRGENIESAKKTLQKLGFKVNLSVLAEPTDPNVINAMSINTVVSQSIEPYTQVNKKGVDITLSYYDHKPEIKNQTTNNNNNNTNNNTTTTPSNNNNTNSGTTNGTTGNNQSGNTSGSSNGTANPGGETQQDTSGKTTN